MKKITIVSAVSFLFLLVCSIVTRITLNVFDSVKTPLMIGVFILTFSGLMALIIRESTAVNITCATLSAIAMGFVMRAWYILR